MKKLYLLPLAALLLSGCEDHPEWLPNLTDKTYEGLEELNIIYDNAPMVGKSATLSDKVLTFDSKINLSDFSEALKNLPPIPGPGILPGSPSLSLDLDLAPNKDKYSVAGSGETEYATYSYLGSLTEDKVDFNFYNVRLKDQSFAGSVWKPAPVNLETGSSPFHIVWETSQPGLLQYFDGSIEDALKLFVTLPLIPAYNNTAYMSASQMIASAVQTLCFNPDGNLVVTYLQTANGAAQFAQAPLCMLQYLPQGASGMRIYVNPTDLVSQILINNTNKPDIPEHPFGKAATRVSTLGFMESFIELFTPEELQAILTNAAPLFSQGIPLQYTKNGTSMDLYLPTEAMMPIIRNIIIPLLSKPEVQQMLIAHIEQNVSLQPYLPLVKSLLIALPLIMETTTKAEIGLSLTAI